MFCTQVSSTTIKCHARWLHFLAGKEMALRGFVLVLFLCCLELTIAKYCNDSSSCYRYETCCSDGVCRITCCSYDSQCGTGKECCHSFCTKTCTRSCWSSYQCGDGKGCCNGYCKTSCSNAGLLSGLIVAIIVFAVIVAIAAFFCCKSSPCYRYCHRSELGGRVIARGQEPAQPMDTTATTTTGHITQVQHPTVVINNPTLPAGFNEPPPPYTVAYSKSPSVAVTEPLIGL